MRPPLGDAGLHKPTTPASYKALGILQAFVGRSTIPRCVPCDLPVRNRNRGGHDRESALSGTLYCYDCADDPPQRLLARGGMP